MTHLSSLHGSVRWLATLTALGALVPGCSETDPGTPSNSPPASGGTSSSGGSNSGGHAATGGAGASSGGAGSGGAPSGGAPGSEAGAGQAGSASAPAGGAAGTPGTGGAGHTPWPFPERVTKPRIMIVGDSISAGPGCYKKYLLQHLTDNRYSSFEFVGEYRDDCGGSVRHSAVSCATADQFTQPSFTVANCFPGTSFPGLSSLVTTHRPDLVMLQLGVNDVWSARSVDAILDSYEQLVEQARAQNPDVVFAVAQIHKIRPDCSSDDSVTRRAEALVQAVPAWARTLSTTRSPIFVADLWTNSDWSRAETSDCVHPNDTGAQRMALDWYNALRDILRPD